MKNKYLYKIRLKYDYFYNSANKKVLTSINDEFKHISPNEVLKELRSSIKYNRLSIDSVIEDTNTLKNDV